MGPRATERFEVVIVGAGIAGASLAYFLAERGLTDVLVVEREDQPAYHATGRSAATLVELDPIPTLQQLKIQGAKFLQNLPEGFSENTVLEQSGVLSLFGDSTWAALGQVGSASARGGFEFRLLGPREANGLVAGVLNEADFAGAVLLPKDGFLDVHELISSYMRHARHRGVAFRCQTEVTGILISGGRCRGVRTATGDIEARLVVNAGGAWVGAIAAQSGALPIRFSPLRRSVAILPAPQGLDSRSWPLVWSEPHSLYFRPETTGVLFCPMDEEPMEPHDAAPGDLAIAEGLERLRSLAPLLVPQSLKHTWGGLRTFSPDRVPVVGEDPLLGGFFWLAGQGGCGIETSPAIGQIAADLVMTGKTERFDPATLSPNRFVEA